jgi:acyl-[acyl-carrier-protein]-phospholipid O-acyltransferase/long-chain-fatty-acid--[acyl-carrier-protein] ligase
MEVRGWAMSQEIAGAGIPVQSVLAGSSDRKLKAAPFLRFVRWLVWTLGRGLTRLVYRIRTEGADHVPMRGGALLVSNHLSMVDAFILGTASRRFVRFIMYEGTYQKPFVRPLANLLGIIPISSEQRPRDLIHSLKAAADAIRQGDLVCIFAEGQITRIGQMLPFRRGFERIVKDLDAPVIPVCLEGVWGSIFSFDQKRFFWKWPRRIPYPVSVSYGRPMSPRSTPGEVRSAVQELGSDAWRHRKVMMEPLHCGFVRTARRHPFRFAMADRNVGRMNFLTTLARTIFIARRLQPRWHEQEKVGILLPPSVSGALVNFSALLMGKVPVNLNYTAAEQVLESCIRQCGITSVVTSRKFIEKLKLKVSVPVILLEQIAAEPRFVERCVALAMACLFPVRSLERTLGCARRAGMDDLATVIFSSGSTGEPKGVMLSHSNVAANAMQMDQIFGVTRDDRFLGVLPFFHSFGFTGTLCLTAMVGIGVVYHHTPLESEAIGRLVRDYNVTFLLSTPTFLQIYLRGCAAEDFGSLRLVMAGAEKLSDRLAQAFEEKFGIRPLEGYGCTECSPTVAVNTRDFRAAGFRQVGAKAGKIGHPLPGVSVRIVDPATRALLPIGQPGLLLVRGPNVMQGYLGWPEKTAEVLQDSWYATGDIAMMDEDGFLQITDRLSRFSKIGGEMVPHVLVEEKLEELAGSLERRFAVTGVGDERKGERLVVLHTLDEAALTEVLEKLAKLELPNLWVPKASQFFRVESLPLLGSGKLDLCKVREHAARLSQSLQQPSRSLSETVIA